MVQYYTLEQAAQILRVTPDKLKEMVKQKKVRAFQDRGTLRFRTQEIDELARSQGLGSDVEMPTNEPGRAGPSSSARRRAQKAAEAEESSDDFDFTLSTEEEQQSVPLGNPPPGASKSTPGSGGKKNTRSSKLNPKTPPPQTSDSDVRLVADGSDLEFSLDLDDQVPKAKSSPPKARPSRLSPKTAGPDSDVRLVPPGEPDSDVKITPSDPADSNVPIGQDGAKTPSDSDIRLEIEDRAKASTPQRPGSDPIITEEIDLDLEEQKLAEAQPQRKKTATSKPAPKAGSKLSHKGSSKLGPKGSSKLGPKAGGNVNLPTSSPFELSEDDIDMEAAPPKADKPLLPDSSSDFDLSPLPNPDPALELSSGEMAGLVDAGDEVSLGDDLSGATGASGINLQDPVDSGISLEEDGSDEMEVELTTQKSRTPKPSSAKNLLEDANSEFELSLDEEEPAAAGDPSDSEFELSLDDSTEHPPSDSEFELSLDDDSSSSEISLEEQTDSASDSEFELTLDEEGGLSPVDETSSLAEEEGEEGEEGEGDLFDSDFNVPSLDEESGSEAMALDDSGSQALALDDSSSSDFDISMDDSEGEEADSGSQVVPLTDEEDVDEGAETVARPKKSKLVPSLEEDEDLNLDLDSETEDEEEAEGEGEGETETETEEEEQGAVKTREVPVEAAPAQWGVLPALMMFPCVIVLFVVGLMGFELIQGMWGYHRATPVSRMIIHPIAKMFDETLKE